MSYPQQPGWSPNPGQQGPWQQPPPGGGPPPPGQPPTGPGPGYGPPPGPPGPGAPPPGGHPGAPQSPYPPPPGGRPPGGGRNIGLIFVVISVCIAILVVVGGVGLWIYLSSGDGNGGSGEGSGAGSGSGTGEGSGSLRDYYEGTWDGSLDQFDASGNPVGTWSLTVEIDGNTISAEEYGLGGTEDGRCTWEIDEANASEKEIAFDYTVTGDPDCVDNGAVTLVPAGDNALDVTVTSVMPDGSEHEATGTLDRQ